MRILLLAVIISLNLVAAEENVNFAKRVDINSELERIDSARQELEAYRAASQVLFDSRNSQIQKSQADLNATLDQITQKEQNIKDMLKQNKKILDEIKTMTNDKVLEVYEAMKDTAAANILSAMSKDEAVKILYALKPKKISTILAKMDPSLAAQLTESLKKDSFFSDQNTTK